MQGEVDRHAKVVWPNGRRGRIWCLCGHLGMKNPADLCLHELFEEQAGRTPENLALEDASFSLSYRELDGLADRLAAYLKSKGIGPDEPVGVYMERRAEYVVACLAAMKAGGAYLVLELAYP